MTAVPRLLASVDLELPLDTYLQSREEVQRIGLANRELIRRCLVSFGIHAQLPTPPTGIGPRTWNERRYGLTDASAAAALGYGLGSRDPAAHPVSPAPPLSAEALALLSGKGAALPHGLTVPTGGCTGQAQRRLAGPAVTSGQIANPYLAQQLSQESFQKSRTDPRVLQVFSRWSKCMLADGHHYSDPLAPFSDPTLQHGPTPEAIDTAVDDVACKKSTNLVGVWYAVESAYQNELIQSHRTALEPFVAANAYTAKLVAQVLGSPTIGN